MTMKPLFLALAVLTALGGCVSSTVDQPAVSRPAAADAGALADLGLDPATARDRAAQAGTANAVNAGLAVGMTQSFGGAGLAGGVLGWLAGPGAGVAGDPHLFVTLEPGQDRRALERRYAESFKAMTGLDPEAEGYQRITKPDIPTAATFIKPGCPMNRHGWYDRSCSMIFRAELYRPDGRGTGATHFVRFQLIGRQTVDHVATLKRMADRHPELTLYIPPGRQGGQDTGARLYRNGKTTSL